MGRIPLSALISAFAIFAALLASPWEANSAGSETISYQGSATADDGTPINGYYAMRFTLYNAKTGGAMLWQENYGVTEGRVIDGGFQVELGSKTPFPRWLFANESQMWLEVEIDVAGDGFDASDAYTPRAHFTSSPFAQHSATADYADSLSPRFPVEPGEVIQRGDYVELLQNGNVRKGPTMLVESLPGSSDYNSLSSRLESLGGNAFAVSFGGQNFGKVDIYAQSSNDVALQHSIELNQGSVDKYVYAADSALISDSILLAADFHHKNNVNYTSIYQIDLSNSPPSVSLLATYEVPNVNFKRQSGPVHIDTLSPGIAVMSYIDSEWNGVFRILSYDGSNTTISSPSFFSPNCTYIFDLDPIEGLNFAVVYAEGHATETSIRMCSSDGASIDFGDPVDMASAGFEFYSIQNLEMGLLIASYRKPGSAAGACTIQANGLGLSILDHADVNSLVSKPNVPYIDHIVLNNSELIYCLNGRMEWLKIDDSGMFIAHQALGQQNIWRIGTSSKTAQIPGFGIIVHGHSERTSPLVVCQFRTPLGFSLGIAAEDYAQGTVPITVQGVSEGHSGLMPGSNYYLGRDGFLTDTVTSLGLGQAISKNNLILNIDFTRKPIAQ